MKLFYKQIIAYDGMFLKIGTKMTTMRDHYLTGIYLKLNKEILLIRIIN